MVPGPNVPTFLLLRFTSTVPESTMNASRPVWPWSTMSEPAGMLISSLAFAIFSRSLVEHPWNRFALRRCSSCVFLLAMTQTVARS